jgi:hypothetical protein
MRVASILGAACTALVLSLSLTLPSASATVLCSKNANPCPTPYGLAATFAGSLSTTEKFVIENELGFVTCNKSELEMAMVFAGSTGVAVTTKIHKLSSQECSRPIVGGTEACTVSAVNVGSAEVEQWNGMFTTEKPPNGNGFFAIQKSNLGSPGFYVICGKAIDCTFTGEPNGAVGGGGPANIVVVWPMKTAGAICPAKVPTWRATWILSKPTPLYVEDR